MIAMLQCNTCPRRQIADVADENETTPCLFEECEGQAEVVNHVDPETGWWAQ
jgi:hypothetical protein